MRHYAAQRVLPYSAQQLFDLVADVERYPEFLPWWLDARIRRRDGNAMHVEQLVGLGPMRLRFSSRAVGQRPDCLRITSDERPFRLLDIDWKFEAAPRNSCRVNLRVSYEFRSAILEKVVYSILDVAIRKTFDAFSERAHRLYGSRHSDQSFDDANSLP